MPYNAQSLCGLFFRKFPISDLIEHVIPNLF